MMSHAPYRLAGGLAAALLGTAATHAADRYVGSAYGRDGDTLLYREVHLDEGARHVILYQCPDGKAFARKVLEGGDDPSQPDYALVDSRTGYEEGVRDDGGKRVSYVRRPGGEKIAKPLPKVSDAIIDAGFDSYIRSHWDTLGKSDTRVNFLLASKARFVQVKISPGGTTKGERRLTLKLDAWYGFAAPTMTATYNESDRTIRRFEGPGTIRDDRGKPRDVRIEFPVSERKPAEGATALDDAAKAPLEGRCSV